MPADGDALLTLAEEIDDLGRHLELVGAELRNFQPWQPTTPVVPTAPPIPPPAYQFDGTARATILLGEAILLVLVAL
jgi:hypothetical protein